MEILYSNSLDFQNSTFQNSISSNDGGALYLSYIKDDITINKCNFYKNNGLNGGAVFLSNERPNITVKIADNIVSGNTAKQNGGGFYIVFINEFEMVRSKFINNKAGFSGGGVYFKSVLQMTINDTEFS